MAANQIEISLGYLADAYEQVDVGVAEKLEQQLFGPVQAAYARVARTRTEFGERHGLAAEGLNADQSPARPHGPHALIEGAVDAVEHADRVIGELQDSLLPVEVGDAELRTGLSDARALLAPLPARARELLRTLGR